MNIPSILPATVAALCLTFLSTVPLLAAPITWGSAIDVASIADVSTHGSQVEAANLAYRTADTSTVTVNGVTFNGVTSPSPLTSAGSSASAFLGGDSSGSASYDALLNTAAFGGGTSTSMSLGGGTLISGQNYEIQVWFVEERATGSPALSTRVMTYGSPGGGTVNVGGTAGNLGQFAIGTFTADGPNQTLTLTTNGFSQSHLTAYQIRAITPAPVITWTSAVDVTGISDVVTDGALVEAFNLGYKSADLASVTVNTVTFAPSVRPPPLNSTSEAAYDYLNGNSSGDPGYDNLLNSSAYGGGTNTTMSVGGGNLVSGQQYGIQLWFVEERAEFSGRVMTYGTPGGPTVNVGGTAGILGQHVTGTFTATGPTQSLTMASNGFENAHLTAYQIRSTVPLPNPTVSLSTVSDPVSAAFTVDVSFNKAVSELESADFTVVNGVASNVSPASGPASDYTVLMTPTAPGLISVQLPADIVTDADTNPNLASNTLQTTFVAPQVPLPTIHGSNTSPTPSHEIFLTFSEDVTGLEPGDFVVVNGNVTSVAPTGRAISPVGNSYPPTQRHFTAEVTASAPGLVEITLPAGSVLSLNGNSETNVASNTFSFQCTSNFSENWIIDQATEWTTATGANSNLEISDGFAKPTANLAQFTSVTKTFPVKRKATSLTFKQSPVWDNWTPVSNIGPTGASDAPVLISVGNGNYYFLGKGSTNGYHAWHSTNMVTWTERGPVTPPVTGRWVTSAEYKNGEFYIYSDYFNDHTPRLFKDSNLDDGVVGTDLGPAFIKTASGSDCALIRSDDDGLFHLIYEDWSPINARNNSWDSPLAGHTTSLDGITGFTAHEHAPPVDLRTNPTGTFGTYNHPEVPNVPYEIHTPTQDAFGDWTSIKIGSRFYLFGDFDQHDAGIKVGRFTSDSIYKKFDFVGSLGSGHPDPTVGFAEGKFYLITQQTTDFTSPGPWVAGVEARAGVDTDGDSTIDQWTNWQAVSEQYGHTLGFIRVVTLTPAALDLSSLPEGYGFQFGFRIDDTVVPGVSPIMDRADFAFAPSNFQQWANARGTPARIDGDHNHNGIPNLVEFAIGASNIPPAQANGTYSLTAVDEALADGYTVQVQFSENLQTWQTATESTPGVTLTDTIIHVNGDEEYVYEIAPVNGARMFWRVLVF